MKNRICLAVCLFAAAPLRASSHMDAPLVTLDPAANTTDVYAFVTARDGAKYLVAALATYPFEEPGIGPNKFNFDDDVLYELHVAVGDDLAAGRATFSYGFQFATRFKKQDTILQSYLGVIEQVDDAFQNLTQEYTVTKVESSRGKRRKPVVLGSGIVPPNNQGNATPFYNQGDSGSNPARDGVATAAELDRYTAAGVVALSGGYRSFAGQRDDAFYADIQAIFDLLTLRSPGVDAQKGFNVHTIVLEIPISELGGDQQVVGVHATTSRRKIRLLREKEDRLESHFNHGKFVQVGRQGNPLFCEGFIAIADKDLYNRTSPARDRELFSKYALNPELATLLNRLVLDPDIPGIDTGRTDIAGIFIPDLIKVDLSTGPARLPGSPGSPTNPDDPGYSRLGIFDGDTLVSTVQQGFGDGVVPGGWPNGRRFGDDVVDIGVRALLSDLRVSPPVIGPAAGDNVDGNDIGYNKVMPYAPTPQNGRRHAHH